MWFVILFGGGCCRISFSIAVSEDKVPYWSSVPFLPGNETRSTYKQNFLLAPWNRTMSAPLLPDPAFYAALSPVFSGYITECMLLLLPGHLPFRIWCIFTHTEHPSRTWILNHSSRGGPKSSNTHCKYSGAGCLAVSGTPRILLACCSGGLILLLPLMVWCPKEGYSTGWWQTFIG